MKNSLKIGAKLYFVAVYYVLTSLLAKLKSTLMKQIRSKRMFTCFMLMYL